MRKWLAWSLCVAAGSSIGMWAADWPSTGGNPQRDGWSQGETLFSKASVSKVKLMYRYHYDNKSVGLNSMTSPIVLSRLIGYHGFEELVLTTGSGGAGYATDADLGVAYFKTPFPPREKVAEQASSLLCPGGQTASMVMFGQSAVSRFGGFGGANPVQRLAAYYTVSADGYIRTMRAQDGQAEMIAPEKLLPPNSNVTGLNFAGSTLYAATINGCGGANGLYAGTFTPPVFPPVPDKPMVSPAKWDVTSFQTNGSGFAGTGGVAASTKDDVVFGTVPSGNGEVAGKYSDTVLALEAKTLKVKDWFTPKHTAPEPSAALPVTGITPAVFAQGGKDYVVAGARDGRIYLLDASALGGSDHHTPLFASDPLIAAGTQASGTGLYGTFATMVEDGQRWVFVAVRGALSMKVPGAAGNTVNGSIVAFKLNMENNRPRLVPAWVSQDMQAPAAPALANGLLFALSSGMPSQVAKANGSALSPAEIGKMSKPASLSILDASTGRQVFISGPVSSFSNSGIAVANGHVYFTTHDNTLYAYGVPEER